MIDLSADLGEGAEGEDEIWPLITSANIACGGHYGDGESMVMAARRARDLGVRLGAHPSYPDRENFGRKSMAMSREDLYTSLLEQIGGLHFMAEHFDVDVKHVKAHGALYNDAHRDRALADCLVEATRNVSLWMSIVCSATSEIAVAARAKNVRVIREAFADRRYEPDGSLVPRSEPGSLLTVEEAADQVDLLAREGFVIARDGSRVPIAFDTICVHADMEHAALRLRAIRKRLGMPLNPQNIDASAPVH